MASHTATGEVPTHVSPDAQASPKFLSAPSEPATTVSRTQWQFCITFAGRLLLTYQNRWSSDTRISRCTDVYQVLLCSLLQNLQWQCHLHSGSLCCLSLTYRYTDEVPTQISPAAQVSPKLNCSFSDTVMYTVAVLCIRCKPFVIHRDTQRQSMSGNGSATVLNSMVIGTEEELCTEKKQNKVSQISKVSDARTSRTRLSSCSSHQLRISCVPHTSFV